MVESRRRCVPIFGCPRNWPPQANGSPSMVAITELPQQTLVVNTGDQVHVVPIWMIRQIARGELYADEDLQKAIAVALLELLK